MSFLLSCKPLRTIPQQFVAPEENNLISRSYCHKRSADYKNLIVRLVTMVPSHNNCNASSFLSPSPTPTHQAKPAAERNGFTANIELLSHHTAIANMGPARGRQVVLKTNSQSGSETVALNSGEVWDGSVTLKNSLLRMILNLDKKQNDLQRTWRATAAVRNTGSEVTTDPPFDQNEERFILCW